MERRGRAWQCPAALRIDVVESAWPIERADAVVAINMVHIARGRIARPARRRGAAARPRRSADPLRSVDRARRPTAASNLAFDADLRARNPQWGLREVEQFADEAARRGLELVERRAMPANNLMLLLRRL